VHTFKAGFDVNAVMILMVGFTVFLTFVENGVEAQRAYDISPRYWVLTLNDKITEMLYPAA
jgi:hypothetical protein